MKANQEKENHIPVASPLAQTLTLKGQFEEAFSNFLLSGNYILGSCVEEFERLFARYCEVSFCVGAANGTDALALALRAVGVCAGDEVITTSHSAVATAAAIEMAGGVPVFADIEPESRCLDPQSVERMISDRTKAIVPVHIYGQTADMAALSKLADSHQLRVVEDCAQAHGAEISGRKAGSFGDAASFSFYPTKNLGALGDGGAVVTGSEKISDRLRELRQYGWKQRYVSDTPGINSRLDELQAALLLVKLPLLDGWQKRRAAIAESYRSVCDGKWVKAPPAIKGRSHAMHLFVVESDRREMLRDYLASHGISSALHYPLPIHRQPAYTGRLRCDGELSNTLRLYQRMLTLPLYPEMTERQVNRVCEALRSWAEGRVSNRANHSMVQQS